MFDFLATLAWCAVAVLAIRRTTEVAHRLMAVLENAVALANKLVPEPPKPAVEVEVPDDLVAVAMQENEAWAQEEVLRAIREKYEIFGDWNKVRASFSVGAIG